jgi:hypothetical protein
MDGQAWMYLLMQVLGALLMAATLLDVFLTVLYARVGTSVFSNRLARQMWRGVWAIGEVFPKRRRGVVYSFCGPLILVALVSLWTLLLAVGAALVIYPRLGTSVQASGGEATPKDFFTALYAGTSALSVVAAGNFSPRTPGFKLFYVACSGVGVCIFPLTLTYVLQIYAALLRRNVTVLRGHLATAESGDAADLLGGLGAGGDFGDARDWLSTMGVGVADLNEAHHFYSLLMYFRFREPFYSVTHLLLVMLDSVSLTKSGLDDRRYARLKESAAMAELWRSSMHLLTEVGPTLLPKRLRGALEKPASDERREMWRRRYFAGLRRLRNAGIATIADEDAGVKSYMALRAQWDRHIVTLAQYMAFDLHEVDPAGSNPEEVDRRDDFEARLRSAG